MAVTTAAFGAANAVVAVTTWFTYRPLDFIDVYCIGDCPVSPDADALEAFLGEVSSDVPDGITEVTDGISGETADTICGGGALGVACGAMVTVAGGPFNQGCDTGLRASCNSTEKPYHAVDVPSFQIDKYEVTTSEFRACVAAGACAEPTSFHLHCSYWDIEAVPVSCVDWSSARSYCAWSGKRLCSESEWEKASRGTDGRTYPWGNEPASCLVAVMDDGGTGCGTDSTWVVGSKPAGASPYGVMDMAGNVAEWVEDDFHDSYVGAPSNGSPWTDSC